MVYFNQENRLPFKFTPLGRIIEFLRLLYVSTINEIRGGSANALKAILMRVVQMVIMIVAFFALMSFTGLRNMGLRGDQILFTASGIFLFFIMNGAFKAALDQNPNAGQNMHAPITPLLTLLSSALAQLYINILTIFLIGLIIHTLIEPISVDNPKKLAAAVFWTWICGISIGTVFGGVGAFFPIVKSLAPMIMMRLNMVFSGKMFAANSLPAAMIPFFWWNPLFHTIDQARDAIFLNYTARYTTMEYTMWFTFAAFAIGLMLLHAAKKLVSASWGARA
ncbi:MAG: ABC transporter permease [Pseudomonadota bacterium]